MRVVTAQPQTLQHLTHTVRVLARMRFPPLARWRERGPGGEGGDRANPSATKTYARPNPLAKAVVARSFPSPPGPLPDPGRGEQNHKTSRAVTR